MRVVFCQCAYSDVIGDEIRGPVLSAIEAAGVDAVVVSDLCALASRRDPRLPEWANDPDTRIVACYPRTVQWLFAWAGASVSREAGKVLNMRDMEVADILSALTGVEAHGSKASHRPHRDGDWVPWFPVIDRDRCRNCRQCLNFCPFGVYELSEEKTVEVRHPENCKTNCPACARLCPDLAIIFPKYTQTPINGAAVEPAHLEKQKQASSLEDRLKKEDIHSLLARRKKQPLGCPLDGADS